MGKVVACTPLGFPCHRSIVTAAPSPKEDMKENIKRRFFRLYTTLHAVGVEPHTILKTVGGKNEEGKETMNNARPAVCVQGLSAKKIETECLCRKALPSFQDRRGVQPLALVTCTPSLASHRSAVRATSQNPLQPPGKPQEKGMAWLWCWGMRARTCILEGFSNFISVNSLPNPSDTQSEQCRRCPNPSAVHQRRNHEHLTRKTIGQGRMFRFIPP